MKISQALDLAYSMFMPDFLYADGPDAINAERIKTEDAIKTLSDAYFLEKDPGFEFDAVLILADRCRELCDQLENAVIGRGNSANIKRSLTLEDTILGVAKLQRRSFDRVQSIVGDSLMNLPKAYAGAKLKGSVVGIDIETTGISPDRSYLINVGWELLDFKNPDEPIDAHSHFCGLPSLYAECGVPLENIHHINWDTIKDKQLFRENKALQKEILETLCAHPYFAHNAAFEDSWFTLHLDGYAQARKAQEIVPVDTREICRRLDPEVARLPRESSPASLESWARRRHTLSQTESEYHQGLEDVELMLKTAVAEFKERDIL